jgi:aryl-alcohol dehydrogenase-like predicted oxidoreductase
LLSGKHNATAGPADNTRFRLGTAADLYQQRYWHEREFAAVAEIVRLANEADLPPATLAVAWVLANDVVTAPILGASRPEQLDQTVAAVDVTLPVDLRERLDELTASFRYGDAIE